MGDFSNKGSLYGDHINHSMVHSEITVEMCMRIFLTGVSCVGKTTIGSELAVLLGCPFFDLDNEIEIFFRKSIARLRSEFLTDYSYRQKASEALRHLLTRADSKVCVIALPPSGLMDNYWRVVKKAEGMIVVLIDTPENILARITFYDNDSKPIEKSLTQEEKRFHLKDIKKDMTYFRRTYKRADIAVDISDLNLHESAAKVEAALKQTLVNRKNLETTNSEQVTEGNF